MAAFPPGVMIQTGAAEMDADLASPAEPHAAIAFVSGSGLGRTSARHRYLASGLNAVGFATLLVDLVRPDEAPHHSRDVPLLAARLLGALSWLRGREPLRGKPVGLCGAAAGAAVAMLATLEDHGAASAIVSLGGRPDVAGVPLEQIVTPTLLLVGSEDTEVMEANRHAITRLPRPAELRVIDGAGHLFEEPGALDEALAAAAGWFQDHLGAPRLPLPSKVLWQC